MPKYAASSRPSSKDREKWAFRQSGIATVVHSEGFVLIRGLGVEQIRRLTGFLIVMLLFELLY